jgi:hypothetical protein
MDMLPKYLYKFEKLNVQTLPNLKNAQVYFNTPASFNDPFDGSVLEASVILTDRNVVELYKRYLQNKNQIIDIEVNSIKDIPQKDIDQIHISFEKVLKHQQLEILNERGCTCFSEVKDNILLWSHYADGHKGICLEFDTSFPLFGKVKEVKYSQKFPSMDPIKMLFGNRDEISEEWLKPLCTKYECWGYEKEWRVFHEKPNIEYGYSVEALKLVYFGLSVNHADLEIVCLALLGQSKDVKFYRACKDTSKYSLSFEELIYTPYVEIKK